MPRLKEKRTRLEMILALSVMGFAAALLLFGSRGPARRGGALPGSSYVPATVAASASEFSAWGLASRKVTEERGEPTGRQAKVEVPGQLRHYSDTRRFLAIQVAEWKEHGVSTPHDYADLAAHIRAGELVEVPTVGDTYVLFGVGGSADKQPFTHYDKSAGESVALLDDAELAREYADADERAEALREEIGALKKEIDSIGKRERTRRAGLQRQLAQQEKALKAEREARALLEDYYGKDDRRRELSAEREALASLAADFRGRDYDLANSRSRLELKVRMLSHLRPEALAVLKELADSYHGRFGRPLPITSLVRPDEYQRRLSATNANATRIDTPPHSTGLAFDILYRHMTAEEQAHVMSDIARLRDAGRVEALRENRDHFHVFAFIDGKRPGEELISGSLGRAVAAPTAKKAEPAAKSAPAKATRAPKKESKAEKKKAARKEAAKKGGKAAGRKRR